MPEAKLLSIIIPLFNESANISRLYKSLVKHTANLPIQTEFIFVDDGSRDDSAAKIKKLAAKHKNIHLLEMTRNFGKEIAITAGLHHTQADVAILIDADLQHPPSLIPQFVKRWRNGADIVVGVRKGGEHSAFRTLSSKLFYGILGRISNTSITPHATDYRLLDRVVIDEFKRFTERNRLSRGLIDWLGFEPEHIYFEVSERKAGQSTSKMKLLNLAINSFVSHSFLPLKLAGYIGVIITLVSGLGGLFIFIEKYIMHDPYNFHFSGPAILAVIILFLVGIILSCMGLMALYIGNIYSEVMNRPMYVVRRKRSTKRYNGESTEEVVTKL